MHDADDFVHTVTYITSCFTILTYDWYMPQVLELGQLIMTKQITSEELTGIFLKRLKRYH